MGLGVGESLLHELRVAVGPGVGELVLRLLELRLRGLDIGLRAGLDRLVVVLQRGIVGALELLDLELDLGAKVLLRRFQIDFQPAGLLREFRVRAVAGRPEVGLGLLEFRCGALHVNGRKLGIGRLEVHQLRLVGHAQLFEWHGALLDEELLVGVREALDRVHRLLRSVVARFGGVELRDGRLHVGELRSVKTRHVLGRHGFGAPAERIRRVLLADRVLQRVLRVGELRLSLTELHAVGEAVLDFALDGVAVRKGRLASDLLLHLGELLVGVALVVGRLHHVHVLARDVETGRLLRSELRIEGLGLLVERDERRGGLERAADCACYHARNRGGALGFGLVQDALLNGQILRETHLARGVALLLRDLDEKRHHLVEVEHRAPNIALRAVLRHRGESFGERLAERVVEQLDLLLGEIEARVGRELLAERVDRRLVHRLGDVEVVRYPDGDRRLDSVHGLGDRDVRRSRDAVGAFGLRDLAELAEERVPVNRSRISIYLKAHCLAPFNFKL